MTGKIVILTGAGISAESGLGTFRDVGGLWTKYDLEDVATPQGFARNPDLVMDFYNARRANAAEAKPNAAHFALAELEVDHNAEVIIVTQNVDSLHEATGSGSVLHMHGAFWLVRFAELVGTAGLRPRRCIAKTPARPAKRPRRGLTWCGLARSPTTWTRYSPTSKTPTCLPQLALLVRSTQPRLLSKMPTAQGHIRWSSTSSLLLGRLTLPRRVLDLPATLCPFGWPKNCVAQNKAAPNGTALISNQTIWGQ